MKPPVPWFAALTFGSTQRHRGSYLPDQFNALLDTKRLDELLGAREMGRRLSLREQQLAFVHGDSQHICVIVRGTTRWVPIAPFAVPDFADLARVMVAKAA